jgi:UDP-3-O-[3-hydroxymyristoyl] glucosamine N-acyltransferase
MPSVTEVVELVGGRYGGPADVTITGVATLVDASADQLSFLGNPKYASQVASSRAAVILAPEDAAGDDPRFLRVKQPYVAMAAILDKWFAQRPAGGISPQASVAKSAQIGSNVTISAFVSIGENVSIGDDTIIYPNVSVYDGCRIGARCIIHSGVVIGSDGFGFAFDRGRHRKIPQIGIVRIEDDVEIGANTAIDRAALGETVIGEGTKIDNHVMVAHNVRIGKHCILVAQSGIAGSTELGDYVVVAGQAGLAGHLKVGDRAEIAAAASVFHDVPEGTRVIGNPAIPFRDWARRDVLLKRLLKKRD